MSGSFAYLTNVPFYESTITATARDYDPQGDEMYQITSDLKQKPAMIELFFLLKKTIISLCIDAPHPLRKKWGRGASVNSLNNFPLQCTGADLGGGCRGAHPPLPAPPPPRSLKYNP